MDGDGGDGSLLDKVHEICFWMNADAMFEKNLLDPNVVEFCSTLSLKSCILSGFYDSIRTGINSSAGR